MKKFLLIGLVFFAALFAGGFLLPAEFRVERSRVLAAEPAAIFAHVANLKTWPTWTAWTKEADPTVEFTFAGTPLTKGQRMTWKGETLREGELRVTQAAMSRGIEYDMTIGEGRLATHGGVLFEKGEDGTTVTWFNQGDFGANPISRYFGLVMDSAMGPDLEKGLEGLEKRVLEGGTDQLLEDGWEAIKDAAGGALKDLAGDGADDAK